MAADERTACKGTTRAGKRCKLPAGAGGYCHLHGPEAAEGLNLRHRAFIDEYFRNGFNGTRAYMEVYPGSSYSAAQTSAHALLRKPNIREEVERIHEQQLMSKGEIESRLARRARARPEDLLRVVTPEAGEDGEGKPFIDVDFVSEQAQAQHHLVKSIRWDSEGRPVITLHDPLDAVRDLARIRGMYKDTEITVNVDVRKLAENIDELDDNELEQAYGSVAND